METKLQALIEAFVTENSQTNLSGIRDPESIRTKLIDDSLRAKAVIESLKGITQIVDAGTGGGFPGLPLAISLPVMQFKLIDTIGKKVQAVNNIISTIGIKNAKAYQSRLENIPKNSADLVVAKALAPLPVTIELCLPICKTGGYLLIFASPDQIQVAKEKAEIIRETLKGELLDIPDFIVFRKLRDLRERREEYQIRKIPTW